MKDDLSPTMLSAVSFAYKHGGYLVRSQGGFWSFHGWRSPDDGTWFGTPTIQALVSRGVMEYTDWQERKRGGRFPIEATLTEKA